MSFFANTWINLDLKHAANNLIIRHVTQEIKETFETSGETSLPMSVKANKWVNLNLKKPIKTDLPSILPSILPLTISPAKSSPPIDKNLRSVYFRDMITLEKHSKSSYSKDEITGKHKKSSYVKEFVQ